MNPSLFPEVFLSPPRNNDINFSILTAVSNRLLSLPSRTSAGERIIEVNTLGTVTEKYELPPTTK